MATLKDYAKTYEPPKTKTIADLKEVSTDIAIEGRTGTGDDGKPFKYQVVIIENEEYRIPGSVIGSLKGVLEKKPDLKKFSVSKAGSGLNTKYTLIPLD